MRESLGAKWACMEACEQNCNEIILFWVMVPYSVVKNTGISEDCTTSTCLHYSALKMEAKNCPISWFLTTK